MTKFAKNYLFLLTIAFSNVLGDENRYIIKYNNYDCYKEAQEIRVHDNEIEFLGSKERSIIDVARIETDEGLESVEENPCVAFVESDYIVEVFETTPYGIDMVQALDVEDLGSDFPSPIKACVLDTGYDIEHPDLPNNHEGFTYHGGDYDDVHGHGTHVAGTVAAIGENGIGVIGVMRSPDTNLVIGKVLSDSGGGYTSDVLDGVLQCNEKGAKVINMSLGGGGYSQAFQDAINTVHANGVIVVAAAGNSGSSGKFYPASYNNVISVAAVDSSQTVASFSTHNEEVDLAAPGVSVESTCVGGGTCSKSGTSMASPHVAGVATLLMSHHPDVDHMEIVNAMQNTAIDRGDPNRDDYYGHGIVQAKEALDWLRGQFPPTVSPGPPPTPSSPPMEYDFSISHSQSLYLNNTLELIYDIGYSATNCDGELLYKGCQEPIENTELLETITSDFDSNTLWYWVGVKTENMDADDGRIVNENGDEVSLVFCLEVASYSDDLPFKISRHFTEYTINYNVSMGSFMVDGLNADTVVNAVDEEIDVPLDNSITACVCDDTPFVCDDDVESRIYIDSSPISICLSIGAQDTNLQFTYIDMQFETTNFVYNTTASYEDGTGWDIDNAFTNVQVHETLGARLSTILVTELFSSEPSFLIVTGVAAFDFTGTQRSESREEFSLNLLLGGNKADDSEGCALRGLLKKALI